MKIKTDRAWQLETKTSFHNTVDIIEHHEGGGTQFACIPIESIDAVVLELLKAKKKILQAKGEK